MEGFFNKKKSLHNMKTLHIKTNTDNYFTSILLFATIASSFLPILTINTPST